MNFGLGQSVKLVLPIIDAFYDKTLKHTVTVVWSLSNYLTFSFRKEFESFNGTTTMAISVFAPGSHWRIPN